MAGKPRIGTTRAVPLQVRFTPEQLAGIKGRARAEGVTAAELVRCWVLEGLGPRETRRLIEHLEPEAAEGLEPALGRLADRAMREGGKVLRWELDDCDGPALVAVLEVPAPSQAERLRSCPGRRCTCKAGTATPRP